MEKRKNEILKKMGTELSEEDRERMVQEFENNLGRIGSLLEADEGLQEDMLKKRLEERKNRRKKMLDKV